MCSLIIYLHCAPLEPQFRLEIKMIWNWLLGLFTDENLFSINFELLKEIGGNGTPVLDESSTDESSMVIESLTSNSSPLHHSTPQRNHLLPDLQSSCLPKNPQFNQFNQKNQSIKPAYKADDLQEKCKEKLSKLNSTSLPDLVPEEERRRLALKEIGIKLRHISESFERSRKK